MPLFDFYGIKSAKIEVFQSNSKISEADLKTIAQLKAEGEIRGFCKKW